MNNEQFRRLIQDSSRPTKAQSSNAGASANDEARGSTLGSRTRSSIPMTPRSVGASTGSANFARQLAEYKERHGEGPPTKKFRSSAAPKGTKLPSGYVDRSAGRRVGDSDQVDRAASPEHADKVKRLQALEEMVKLGQMDRGAFLQIRRELGFPEDPDAAARAKGLDFALLERTRRGEAADGQQAQDGQASKENSQTEEDLEAALDAKAQEEVAPVQKEVHEKKGTFAAPPPLTSADAQKLSRDEILKRHKASRATAAAAADNGQADMTPEATLGTKFKKIGAVEKKRWIETDEKTGRRREVLLTTDKEGNPKRKVKWLDREPVSQATEPKISQEKRSTTKANVLGMEVPAEILARQKALQAQEEDDKDDDIFAGIGTSYDPLGGDAEAGADESGSEEGESEPSSTRPQGQDREQEAKQFASTGLRNYFATSMSAAAEEEDKGEGRGPLASDPTILTALKRAAALRQAQEARGTQNESSSLDAEASDKHKRFLDQLRQREREDAADLDLGFGESRFGDEEDDEQGPWEEGEKKSSGRKRGPKKRKGNKESVDDVMRVLEGRRKET